LDRIEVKPTSIERDTFPAMAAAGQLFAMDLQGFWMDVGQPGDYLVGLGMLLDSLKKDNSPQLYVKKQSDDFEVIQPVLIHPSAKIGRKSVIGPNVTIAADCVVGEGTRLQNTALMEGVEVANSSWINKSIIGWHSRVGSWCRIQNGAVFGEDVSVSDGL
jgi:mannose-1-phosphate guanylyltransferase